MNRYVALLRGVNVGGINLKMVDVAKVLVTLGFEHVKTVLGDEPRDGLLALQPDLDPALEALAPGDGVLYWTVERGQTLDSIVGKASSRARYKALTTTRNLRTLQKLLGNGH